MNNHFCKSCDTEQPHEQKRGTVIRHHLGRCFIFEDVPSWACSRCGHVYLDLDVLLTMEKYMETPPAHARPVKAWAISLSEKAE